MNSVTREMLKAVADQQTIGVSIQLGVKLHRCIVRFIISAWLIQLCSSVVWVDTPEVNLS